MGNVEKHLKSFDLFIKKGVISNVGDTVSDDEYGTLWTSITIGGEELRNVNCGQLLGNKLLLAANQQDEVELSFVKYNNGAEDFNSIAALKTPMGIISDVDFSVSQLRAAAAKMRRYGSIGTGLSVLLIATVIISMIGMALLVPSIILLYRAKRPARFADALEAAAKALN